MSARILLTGADGFTGQHLAKLAIDKSYSVYELQSDLADQAALRSELADERFDYVLHLAALSAPTHADQQALYQVNLFGTLNLLSALNLVNSAPRAVLIVSSANVYGNSELSPIDESACPRPINHYAMSKLAMEYMVAGHYSKLPLIIVRPFNYTGVGHDGRFVIPKLVEHFSRREPVVELGNMSVEREFNDVRTVCQTYLDLLDKGVAGETYNVCSGRTYSLRSVLALMSEITGHHISAVVNPDFLRQTEIQRLCGNPAKLEACLGPLQHPPLEETLAWMLAAG